MSISYGQCDYIAFLLGNVSHLLVMCGNHVALVWDLS